MPEVKKAKFVALRLHNITRSCVLMCQFHSGVWTIPVDEIPVNDDPIDHIDRILKEQISGEFELISAINIAELTEPTGTAEVPREYTSIVYDIRYKGKVFPDITPKMAKDYIKCQWMQPEALKRQKDVNYATRVLISAMEKEPCL